ncbi:Ltp family lipoprotein [Isoptericola sp. NPDC057653]|uniref:Ltp family lipoprotein n=1 Tax=Isoptericola sp. NPDC057653 TaxID=3346195 RepID=UPI0036C1583E
MFPTRTQSLGAAVTIAVAGLVAGCGSADDGGSAETADAVVSEPAAKESPAEDAQESDAEDDDATVAQANAVASAQSYLEMGGFSKSGLMDQLEFEGYSKADAKYAVAHVDVDWDEQAEIAAKNYMDTQSFSRSGLVDQLEFDGFTAKQAEHGADSVGL